MLSPGQLKIHLAAERGLHMKCRNLCVWELLFRMYIIANMANPGKRQHLSWAGAYQIYIFSFVLARTVFAVLVAENMFFYKAKTMLVFFVPYWPNPTLQH